MKMYVKPLTKEVIKKYLSLPDLTLDDSHAIGLLYRRLEQYMREAHPDSTTMVIRKDAVVTVEDNYDNLLIAPDNISRSSTYTQYVDKQRVLRTHTSALIPGILRELAGRSDWDDVVIIVPGLAYRRDVSDKTHLGEIHMLETWRISRRRRIIKQDLLSMMTGLADVAAPGWSLRIIDSPHPYTEQGIEVNAVQGDRDIEIGEAGLINPEILRRAGLDPAIYSGWASGMGLDRLVITLKGLPDVRYLRSGNPEIARQMHDLEPYREVSNQPAIKRDLSYSVPQVYVEEDISDEIRQALGDRVKVLESVEILSETAYSQLPDIARERLGCQPRQKNILVRITLRDLERTITNQEANEIYEQIYAKINYGSGGYL